MNPLAVELNQKIQDNNPHIFEMLSPFGQRVFFPKGILSQSAEAKKKAHRFNATIGIALEKGVAMHLDCIHDWVKDLDPEDIFPYAPASGKPALREIWLKKQLTENPAMRDKNIGKPIVTSALTHGLGLVGDLFVGPGDTVILPDKFWGNYRLAFEVRKEGRIVTYPFYTESGGFNVEAFAKTLEQEGKDKKKLVVLLNFPNNPCGYTISREEADAVTRVLKDVARQGTRLVTVLDEAYFGLFYTEGLMTESLFGHLVNQEERLLVVKLDGATKEKFVWGLRVGFITFGATSEKNLNAVYEALEKKIMGAIRSYMSNGPHLSQSLVLKGMESPEFEAQRAEKFALMKARAQKVLEVVNRETYQDAWEVYPFNSGYFMCIRVKGVEGEALRLHLLNTYGVGLIAAGGRDIRIAFSCIEEEDVEELFEMIYKGVKDLQSRS